MAFDLKYHIKKVIYKNSQLVRDNRTQIKKFFYIGGEDLTIIYKNYEYTYTQLNVDDYYILYSYDEFECVSVIIDKKNKVGEIHGIGNFKSCLIDSNTKVGSTLLKITIKMLKKYKDLLGINKIVLTDNSVKNVKLVVKILNYHIC